MARTWSLLEPPAPAVAHRAHPVRL